MEYMGQAAGDAAWPLLFWEHLCALSADWQGLKNLQGEEAKLQKRALTRTEGANPLDSQSLCDRPGRIRDFARPPLIEDLRRSNLNDRILQATLTMEAKIVPVFHLIRAIFAFAGFVRSLKPRWKHPAGL